MNNYLKSFISALILVLVIAACGGGGSDSGGGGGATPAGMFTKTVALSIAGTSSTALTGTNAFRHYQVLYKPADIAGSGWINSIYFRYNEDLAAPGLACPGVTIKLAHTSVDDLYDDMSLNIVNKGSAVTVLNNATVNIPAGTNGDYFEIPLSTQFNYNGVDNLVLDVTRTIACVEDLYLRTGHGTTTYTAYRFTNNSGDPDNSIVNGTDVFHTKFVFAGGENKIICADKTGNSQIGIAPGYTGRTQMLILASDINGSGLITGMALNPDSSLTANAEVTGMTVKIAHIPAGTTTLVGNIFADNYGGVTPVTVTQDLSYKVPEGQPSSVWIPFNTNTFAYDGTSNLLIDISCTIDSGNYSVDYQSLPAGVNRVLYSTTGPGATDGTLRERVFEPVFRFYGSTVNVVASDTPGIGIYYPFNDTENNKIQYLYSAAEIGVKGTITKIALRLFSDVSLGSNYGTFTVVLGQTTNTILGDTTFSTNLTGAQTAYSGSFNIPGGTLVKGDWIEIPLSTPFICDPAKNFVVQLSSLAGTATNSIVRKLDNTRYLNRQAHADSNTTDNVGGRNNCLADIKLEVR